MKKHIIVKSLQLGVLLLIIRIPYILYLGKTDALLSKLDPTQFLSYTTLMLGVLLILSFVALIILVLGNTLLYPLKRIRISTIFLTLLFIAWIIYSRQTIVPFVNSEDFFAWIIAFLPCGTYLLASSLVIGIYLQKMFEKKPEKPYLKKRNIQYLILVAIVGLGSIFLLYGKNKVDQPPLPSEYVNYPSLESHQTIESTNYKLVPLENTNKQPVDINKMPPNSEALKVVYFNKTHSLANSKTLPIKLNGTNYYNLIIEQDTLRFKLDNIYDAYPIGTFIPPYTIYELSTKTLDYYNSPPPSTPLLILNKQKQFIIKRINN